MRIAHRFSLASLVAAAAALIVFMPASSLHAQRLPTTVTPQHYTLTLTPDLKTATFTGKEEIDVTLAQPSTSITLNAAQITFKSVTGSADSSETSRLKAFEMSLKA